MQKQNWFQRLLSNFQTQVKTIDFRRSLRGVEPPDPKAGEQLVNFEQWVYSCVNAIAEEVAQINIHLFQLKNGDAQEVENSKLIDLLYRVNPFQTFFDFIYLHETYMGLTGESYWLLERGKDNPKPTDEVKELWLLRPDLVEVVPDEKNFVKGYLYRSPSGKQISLLPHEVIAFKQPNPLNIFRGYSPVKAGAISIDVFKFSGLWNRSFFFNSARTDAVLKVKDKLTDEQWKRLQAQWESNFGSINKAHRVAVLEEGTEYQQISVSPKDMDFANLKNITRDEIMSIFRVPKSILGITDDVNRANAEATIFAFSRFVVKPKMRRIVDTLNEFFVPLFGDDLWLDYDDPVPDDREKTVSEYTQGHNKWLTINDIRDREGLPPVSGGDAIYQSIALLPVGTEQEPPDTEQAGAKPAETKVFQVNKTGFMSQRTKDSIRNLKAGKKMLQVREQFRREIQAKIDSKRAHETFDDKVAKDRAELIANIAETEADRDFIKAENEKLQSTVEHLSKENVELKEVAQQAIDASNGK